MQPQNITSFLAQNHLVVESDNQLFNFSGQRNLNRTAIASRAIKQGEIIYNIQPYSYTEEPNFLSVQISDQEHIFDQLLEAMNHSCSPTTSLAISQMQVIAERDILPGEELTYFYPSTEWEMNRPFQCNCNSPQCIGYIAGAKSLSTSQMVNFKLNPHIKSLIKKFLNLEKNS